MVQFAATLVYLAKWCCRWRRFWTWWRCGSWRQSPDLWWQIWEQQRRCITRCTPLKNEEHQGTLQIIMDNTNFSKGSLGFTVIVLETDNKDTDTKTQKPSEYNKCGRRWWVHGNVTGTVSHEAQVLTLTRRDKSHLSLFTRCKCPHLLYSLSPFGISSLVKCESYIFLSVFSGLSLHLFFEFLFLVVHDMMSGHSQLPSIFSAFRIPTHNQRHPLVGPGNQQTVLRCGIYWYGSQQKGRCLSWYWNSAKNAEVLSARCLLVWMRHKLHSSI